MKDTINFNRETPTYDAVARFYLTPIDKFKPWKYMAPERLEHIMRLCFKNGTKQTQDFILKHYTAENLSK